MKSLETSIGMKSLVGLADWKSRFIANGRLGRGLGNVCRCLSAVHCGRITYYRGKHLVTGGLWLLLMIACAACQISSLVPAGTATVGATPNLVSTSTPLPDESRICQSHGTSKYVLPFPVGIGYTCIQGYVGRTYHVGVFKYGLDFDMPMRSLITAAREGIVIFTEATHSDQEDGTENANVVIVQHEDGTYGRYIHITKDGVLVTVGQSVAQGDPIGLSGSSGDPGLPHLHFDVTEECPQPDCRTIPVCFRNTQPHPAGLTTHEYYMAGPY